MNKPVVKTMKGLAGSVATFIRPRDGARIYVFPKKRETVEAAITRVKTRNGAAGVEHALVQN